MTEDEEGLRDRIAAVLRANRELGAGYERQAVDQIVDIMREGSAGGGPRGPGGPTARAGATGPYAAPPEPPPGPRAWRQRGRGRFGPVLLVALALLLTFPAAGALMAAAVGAGVIGLIVVALLARVVVGGFGWGPWTPWGGGPWNSAGPGAPGSGSSRESRRGHHVGGSWGP